jgi:hypothetical protein
MENFMAEEKTVDWEGYKTFFIVPDLSLMPEEFILNFFAQGFETYYVMDDHYLDIAAKVRIILDLFPNVFLFFNIDRRLSGVDWPLLVRNLHDKYGERAKIGVLCGKHIGSDAIAELERTYLYNIGIYCGCIPLEYHKAKNLQLLSGVLAANEARGRRNFLRAICGDTCTLNFTFEEHSYRGIIQDISVSHFSCAFVGRIPDLKMYEKVDDIQLNLGGIICAVDGVVFAKRGDEGSVLFVFVFRDSRNRDGLDAEMSAKINGFIHRRFDQGVRAALSKGFSEEIAKRRQAKLEAPFDKDRALSIMAP